MAEGKMRRLSLQGVDQKCGLAVLDIQKVYKERGGTELYGKDGIGWETSVLSSETYEGLRVKA